MLLLSVGVIVGAVDVDMGDVCRCAVRVVSTAVEARCEDSSKRGLTTSFPSYAPKSRCFSKSKLYENNITSLFEKIFTPPVTDVTRAAQQHTIHVPLGPIFNSQVRESGSRILDSRAGLPKKY